MPALRLGHQAFFIKEIVDCLTAIRVSDDMLVEFFLFRIRSFSFIDEALVVGF